MQLLIFAQFTTCTKRPGPVTRQRQRLCVAHRLCGVEVCVMEKMPASWSMAAAVAETAVPP